MHLIQLLKFVGKPASKWNIITILVSIILNEKPHLKEIWALIKQRWINVLLHICLGKCKIKSFCTKAKLIKGIKENSAVINECKGIKHPKEGNCPAIGANIIRLEGK